jgi:GxxExxY protein
LHAVEVALTVVVQNERYVFNTEARRHGATENPNLESNKMTHNEVAGIIFDVAIDIHKRLGPGLLESVYSTILSHELIKRDLRVQKEVPIPLVWDNLRFEVGFRADLIINDLIIVEIKSIDALAPVHKKQVLTYLRITGKKLGLIINFGEEVLKDGMRRVINGTLEEPG